MPRNIATTDRVGRDEMLDFVRPRHRPDASTSAIVSSATRFCSSFA